MMMSKNLIKVLAACGDDINLEEIYNEIGKVLGKDENPEEKKKVASLHDFNGIQFDYESDAKSYMKGQGFDVISDHVYNGSESASIISGRDENSRLYWKVVCDN